VAQAPVPARATALRDGYALRADEIVGASSYAPVLLAQKPSFVSAGDVLPEGCDCIIEANGLDLDGPLPLAMVESFPGENVRRAGEDFAQGAVMLRAGECVSAVACAALAAAGISSLPVRAPVISVQGEECAPKNMLVSLLAAEGARSEGKPDFVVWIGAPQGDVIARNLALESGRGIVLAMNESVPTIFLSSRIDEALAAVAAFILPAFDHLAGHKRSFLRLPLAQKIASRVGLSEIALLAAEEGRFHVLAVGDLPLQSVAAATHVALIAADSEGHAAGDLISAVPVRA
jgi:molybdopterin biosynthesis enzyme